MKPQRAELEILNQILVYKTIIIGTHNELGYFRLLHAYALHLCIYGHINLLHEALLARSFFQILEYRYKLLTADLSLNS